MGNRLTKIYTRTGDAGQTGLGDGSRTAKTHARVVAMGDIDELNCQIGVLLTAAVPQPMRAEMLDVQHVLFNIGGEVSIPGYQIVTEAYVEQIEKCIDQYNEDLPPLKDFILPGGNAAAAQCHLARAVCRRAERALLRLQEIETINEPGKVYLNRLSDLLFVLARVLSRQNGDVEVYWEKDRLND